MKKDCNHSGILLNRNGTDQNQRFLKALDPGSIKLHDFNMEDWMAFAYQFAGSVNYFDINTNEKKGSWEQFFIQKAKISEMISKAETNNDLNPHLTLFVCFLNLIGLSHERLNNLSKRHLDFYYKEVLNLSKQKAKPDKVNILFTLAKNATEVRIEEGTSLDAGKDGTGVKRIYETQKELIVNKAQVVLMKIVFHEKNNGIKYSEVANSFDGLGKDFPNNEIKWWPFGHPDFKNNENIPNLPKAKIGFAIGSPILLLKEGKRKVIFTIKFENQIKVFFNKESLSAALTILLSGEKEWIPANIIVTANGVSSMSGNTLVIETEISEALEAIVPYNKKALKENFNSSNPVARFLFKAEDKLGHELYNSLKHNKILEIAIDVRVEEMQELIVENDLGRLDVSKAFMPFGPKPEKGSNFYIGCQEALNKPWSNISINIQWKDTPFYENVNNHEHFKENYKAYRKEYLNNFGKNIYTLKAETPKDILVAQAVSDTASETKSEDSKASLDINLNIGPIVNDNQHFKVSIETLNDKTWEARTDDKGENFIELFKPHNDSYNAKLTIEPSGADNQISKGSSIISPFKRASVKNSPGTCKIYKQFIKDDFISTYGKSSAKDFEHRIMGGIYSLFDDPIHQEYLTSDTKKGFLRLSLQQSFLHGLYPKLYTIALSDPENALIPNEPYTPLVESVRLAYTANISKSFELENIDSNLKQNLTDYLDESVELFHEHPFGQSEQHTYLRTKHDFIVNKGCPLVPKYEHGELYIALENAEQLQQVSLLIQLLEGTENPEYEGDRTFEGKEKLEWFILSYDEWKPLNENFIITNATDNFLRSGIVRVSIPKEATKNNNRLTGDYLWLKIKNVKEFDTVCQLINIHAQAEIAEFSNNNNELSHLQTGLAGNSISKMVERLAKIKSVAQPYSSFDGVPQESDPQFYRRISERLRHKKRAITIWDYEHLILQEFPKIYKVNCLKHTSVQSQLSPGNVSIIVIPNIIDQNVFDIYKPRISKTNRNDIQNFINNLNTLHVYALVENPSYQEVKVSLKVKFHIGKDENFYSKQLKKDLVKFLAPWAYKETEAINFGLTLYKSVLIHYVEKLNYVDYIKDFEMKLQTDKKDVNGDIVFKTVDKVIPLNSKVILTSVKYEQHQVEVVSKQECDIE